MGAGLWPAPSLPPATGLLTGLTSTIWPSFCFLLEDVHPQNQRVGPPTGCQREERGTWLAAGLIWGSRGFLECSGTQRTWCSFQPEAGRPWRAASRNRLLWGSPSSGQAPGPAGLFETWPQASRQEEGFAPSWTHGLTQQQGQRLRAGDMSFPALLAVFIPGLLWSGRAGPLVTRVTKESDINPPHGALAVSEEGRHPKSA